MILQSIKSFLFVLLRSLLKVHNLMFGLVKKSCCPEKSGAKDVVKGNLESPGLLRYCPP